MSDPNDSTNKPYFAPAATEPMPEGEDPAWGGDAEEIARGAGLGSYGTYVLTPEEQVGREEALIQSLEKSETERRRQHRVTIALCLYVALLSAGLVWLALR